MTDPITPKLSNRYACYTDGTDIACNSPSIYISTDGNAGLGTNNPSARLEISAPNSQVRITDSDGGSVGVLQVNASKMRLGNWSNGGFTVIDLVTGALGISTSNPLGKLDVVGTISASDAVQVGDSALTCTAPINGAIKYTGGALHYCTGTTWTALGNAGATTAASSTGAVQFNSGGALAGDTDNFFWDDANDRLGIGTQTPSGTLHVAGTGALYNDRAGASTTGAHLLLRGANGTNMAPTATASGDFLGTITFAGNTGTTWSTVGGRIAGVATQPHAAGARGTALTFFTTPNGSTTFAERVRIDHAGSVGIGTQSPTATLQVSGTFAVSSTGQTTTPSLYVASSGYVGIGTVTPSAYLHIATPGNQNHVMLTRGGFANGFVARISKNVANRELLLINAVGKAGLVLDEDNRLGISNSTPQAMLDVAGTISASDAVQVGDSSLVCSAPINGAIKYSGGGLHYCTGTTWTTLGTAGASTAASSTGAVQFNSGNTFAGDTANFFWNNVAKTLGLGTNSPSGTLHVNGLMVGGIGAATTSGVQDWNDISNARSGSGYTLLRGAVASNAPIPGESSYFHPFSFEYASKDGTGSITQFAIPYGTNAFSTNALERGVYLRSRYMGTWGGWYRIPVTTPAGLTGINTLSPTANLQVSGTFIVSRSGQTSNPSLFVSSNGNVGIGSASPDSPLYVKGATNGSVARFSGAVTDGGIYMTSAADNHLAIMGGAEYDGVNWTARATDAAGWVSYQGRNFFYGDRNLTIGNTFTPTWRFMVDSVGNVSASGVIDVGHTALACSSVISGSIRYETTSDTIQVCTSSGWKSLASSSVVAGSGTAASSTGAIQFNSGNTFAGDTSNFFWDNANKRLGIGTNTPQSAIDLGAGTGGRSLVWGGPSSSHWYASIGTEYGSADLAVLSGLKLSTSTSEILYSHTATTGASGMLLDYSAGDIRFFNEASGAKTAGNVFDRLINTKVIIRASGNVGIGTSEPGSPLHVSGTGQLRLSGVIPRLTIEPFGNGDENLWNIDNAAGGLRFFSENYSVSGTGGGGSVKMIIASPTGFVGIGTNSPVARLSVGGNVSVSGMIDVGHTAQVCAAGISGSIRFEATSDTIQVCTGSGWKSLASNTVAAGGGTAASSTGAIQFNVGGSFAGDTNNLYWDTANQRLGIGMTNPAVALHISDSVASNNVTARIENTNATGYSSMVLGGTTNYGGVWKNGATQPAYAGYNGLNVGTVGTGDLGLVTANNVKMIIKNSGLVGIGMGAATPTTSLQVSATSPIIGLSGISTTWGELRTMDETGANKWSVGNYGDGHATTAIRNSFYIYQYSNQNDLATNAYRMVIDDAGNIGIGGSVTPTTNLQIGSEMVSTSSEIMFMTGGAGGRIGWSAGTRYGATTANPNFDFVIANRGSNGTSDMIRMLIDWSNGNVGIGTVTPTAQLDVSGSIQYTGTITDISDRRLKRDIASLPKGDVERLMMLKPVSFKMNMSGDTEYGFIAQDVQQIYPTLVKVGEDPSQTLSLNYPGMIAPMVNAMQELKRENDTLKLLLRAANDNAADLDKRVRTLERAMNRAN